MKTPTNLGARRVSVRCLVALLTLLAGALPSMAEAPATQTTDLRTVRPLASGWRFVQDDALADEAAAATTGNDWQPVTLPHSWNANNAATTHATMA